MLDLILFIIYKFFKFLVFITPKFLVKPFLDGFANFIYYINIEHKRYAKANLDLVYKDTISESEKYTIIKGSYKNIIYNLYDFIENQTLDIDGFNDKIKINNEDIILKAIKDKRKIILITAHYGNWEYGSSFIPLRYLPTTMVGRPMNNKYLNKELNDTRTRNNTKMITTKEAGRGLVKALRQGRLVGLVIDQHNRTGIEVEFLGQKVLQADSPSRLALKFDAVIIPMFFTMQSFGKYTADVYPAIEPKEYTGDDAIQKMTQKQADIMSEHILKKPEQWLWQHKRFKHFHKEIYAK